MRRQPPVVSRLHPRYWVDWLAFFLLGFLLAWNIAYYPPLPPRPTPEPLESWLQRDVDEHWGRGGGNGGNVVRPAPSPSEFGLITVQNVTINATGVKLWHLDSESADSTAARSAAPSTPSTSTRWSAARE